MIVTLVDGARLAPDIEIAVPAGPVEDSNDATGDVPIVNDAVGWLVASDAVIMLSAFAVAGTTNDPTKPPVLFAVTGVTGVSVVALSLNVIACDGTKLRPVTLTVWPATPLDGDSEIADVVTVIVVCVPAESFAWNGNEPEGFAILNVPVIAPVAVDLITAGVVTTEVPSLIVKLNTLFGVKLVPDIVTVVPLEADDGVSVIPGATANVANGLLVPSVALTKNVPAADAGTLNVVLLKLPSARVVTVAGVVTSVTPLNLNVTACDGIRLLPDNPIV